MKLNFFENIYRNSISAIQNGIRKKFKNEEELYFHEQFEQYLKAQDSVFCFKMIDEGYKISNSQKNILEELFIKQVTNSKIDYSSYKNIDSVNPKLKMMGLIYSMPKNYITYDQFKKHQYISGYNRSLTELFSNEENKKIFINLFKEKMNEYGSYLKDDLFAEEQPYSSSHDKKIDSKRNIFDQLLYLTGIIIYNELLKQQEINEIKECTIDLNKYIHKKCKKYTYVLDQMLEKTGHDTFNNFVENIELMQQDYLSRDNKKDVLLNQLKKYHVRNKSLTEEIKELIVKEEYSLDSLPLEAKEKVENIQKIVQGLNSKEATDFTQERLPIILKRYFSIDEEYRTELKNVEGFNAQELMLQSLDNIERIVKAKQEDNNYDLLSELSVENRKLKAKV